MECQRTRTWCLMCGSLPNPHFVPRLREFTGKDPKVRRYIRSFSAAGEFLRRVEGLLAYLIPHYAREGKKLFDPSLLAAQGEGIVRWMSLEAVRKYLEKPRGHREGCAPRH